MDNLSDMLVGKPRPEGNGPTGTKIDFMNMRRVQSVDGLTEKFVANPPSERSAGSIVLSRGLWTCCRNRTASGAQRIV